MKKLFSAFLLIVALQPAFGQHKQVKLVEANAAFAGMDAKTLEQIDSVMDVYVKAGKIAGLTAIVARNGKIVYYKGIGYNDVDAKTPMARDQIFRIASQTKAITSVAVMMLHEKGKFLLDDPLSMYLPEFANPKVIDQFTANDTSFTTVPAKREITIRDLLTHTSGIGYAQIGGDPLKAIYAKNNITAGIATGPIVLETEIKKLAAMPLLHQPGEKFTYGLNTDVLGRLVEKISGKSLAAFFADHIFNPLGMKDSYFYLPLDKQKRLTPLYGEKADKTINKKEAVFQLTGPWISDFPNTAGTYFSGGGGLVSTAYDYAIFMQMLLNGGSYNGKRILGPNTVKLMTINQIGKIDRGDQKFGLGFGIYLPEAQAKLGVPAGTFEWGGMFSSTYWIDPEKKLIGQVFVNQLPMSHGRLHQQFKAMVYAALED